MYTFWIPQQALTSPKAPATHPQTTPRFHQRPPQVFIKINAPHSLPPPRSSLPTQIPCFSSPPVQFSACPSHSCDFSHHFVVWTIWRQLFSRVWRSGFAVVPDESHACFGISFGKAWLVGWLLVGECLCVCVGECVWSEREKLEVGVNGLYRLPGALFKNNQML